MQMRNNKFTRSNSLIGTWEKKGRHKTKLHLHIEGIRSQGLIVYYGSVLKKNSYFFWKYRDEQCTNKQRNNLHIIVYLTAYHSFYILLQIACNSHKNESKVLYKIQC